MERFLQMSDEDPYIIPEIDERPEKWGRGAHLGKQMQHTNFQLVNCTTPANYFHVLRRQARPFISRTAHSSQGVNGGSPYAVILRTAHSRSEWNFLVCFPFELQ